MNKSDFSIRQVSPFLILHEITNFEKWKIMEIKKRPLDKRGGENYTGKRNDLKVTREKKE